MSEIKYRLLKDLPDYKAGEIFEWDENTQCYAATNSDEFGQTGKWPARFVENKPDWFESIKESISVSFISATYAERLGINQLAYLIKHEKGSVEWNSNEIVLIRAAINGEVFTEQQVRDFARYNAMQVIPEHVGGNFKEWLNAQQSHSTEDQSDRSK